VRRSWWPILPKDPAVSGSATLSTVGISYPTQLVGTPSAAISFTLTNKGTSPLSVAIKIAGPDAGDFRQNNDCKDKVGPTAACTISVIFSPNDSGIKRALLSLMGTDQTVSLSGIGK
jgi:hypothetical protein